jgi:hypothetical protein
MRSRRLKTSLLVIPNFSEVRGSSNLSLVGYRLDSKLFLLMMFGLRGCCFFSFAGDSGANKLFAEFFKGTLIL